MAHEFGAGFKGGLDQEEVIPQDGDLKVTASRSDHDPIRPAVGYRFDWKGRSVAYPGGPRRGRWNKTPVTMATKSRRKNQRISWCCARPLPPARWSIRASWNLMYRHAVPMVALTLQELWRDGEDRFLQRRTRLHRQPPRPPVVGTLRPPAGKSEPSPARNVLIESEQAIDATMMRQWILLYDASGASDKPDPARFQRLTPPPDRVWADPFIVQAGGQSVVLFEEHLLCAPACPHQRHDRVAGRNVRPASRWCFWSARIIFRTRLCSSIADTGT